VTKCDTNTSPRRLATHLLQQVVQSLTSRRHNGHGSTNATRNNTKANDKTIIAKASKASSKYHTMEALCGDPESTGTIGCRAATYSTSSGMKSGSSPEKQLVKQGWAQTYSTSSTPPTEGLISRSCTRYVKDQDKVYLQYNYSWRGSFSKIFLQTILITQVPNCFEKTYWGLPDSPSAVAQAHSHTLFQKTTHAMETIPTQTLVLWPHRDSSNTMDKAIRIGFTLCRGCTSLPTSRVPPDEHLRVGADPIKAITHLS
jgi:hypothetical protein